MKKIKLLIILFLLICPFKTFALNNNYEDKISNIVNTKVENNKINFYLFHGQECPHCKEEKKWINELETKYKNKINFIYYEVWHNKDNQILVKKVKTKLNIKEEGVPLTIIGNKYYVGFSKTIQNEMEKQIELYLNNSKNSNYNIPILGNINIKNTSLTLITIILGFIDGFNPCAMWILLFLINLLIPIKNKKKAWLFGLLFLFTSGFIYFLSMLGINLVLGVAKINIIKLLLGTFIFIAGIINLKKYIETRNDSVGCKVVDNKKRKIIITKIKNIINNKSLLLSLIGIITLAVSVNLIELTCSLGFPLIYTEILAINKVKGIIKFIYLTLYILLYLIDDIIVFIISMYTLSAVGITNKYNKLITLISSIIMILIGLLLIFKPSILMLNF